MVSRGGVRGQVCIGQVRSNMSADRGREEGKEGKGGREGGKT